MHFQIDGYAFAMACVMVFACGALAADGDAVVLGAPIVLPQELLTDQTQRDARCRHFTESGYTYQQLYALASMENPATVQGYTVFIPFLSKTASDCDVLLSTKSTPPNLGPGSVIEYVFGGNSNTDSEIRLGSIYPQVASVASAGLMTSSNYQQFAIGLTEDNVAHMFKNGESTPYLTYQLATTDSYTYLGLTSWFGQTNDVYWDCDFLTDLDRLIRDKLTPFDPSAWIDPPFTIQYNVLQHVVTVSDPAADAAAGTAQTVTITTTVKLIANWHVGIAWSTIQYGNIRSINIPPAFAQKLNLSYNDAQTVLTPETVSSVGEVYGESDSFEVSTNCDAATIKWDFQTEMCPQVINGLTGTVALGEADRSDLSLA